MALITSAALGAAATTAAMRIGNLSLKKVQQAVASGSNISSLADLSRPARVEPLVIVEKELADESYMPDVMRTVQTLFTGYYLQAIALTMNVGTINTLRTLDALNPHRSLGRAGDVVQDIVFSREAFSEGLPAMEAFEQPMAKNVVASLESQTATVDNDSLKTLRENDNLAVGKLVTVELKDGEHSAKLPVLIKLVPVTAPASSLSHIFTATAKNTTWKERWFLWRAGQISFIRDLVLAGDLIDNHRQAQMDDTTNVYSLINDRRRNNAKRALLSGKPSLAEASNIAVISTETAREIGREMGGKLDSLNIRKKVFDASYLMLLVVVDERWERITVYHRGIDEPTTAKFTDLKSSEKGKGPDITEILAAYRLGNTPTI